MPARQGHKTPGENDLDADFERGLRSIFLYSLLYTTLGYSNFHDAWIEFSESLSIQKGFFYFCRFSTLEECKGTCTVDASTQEALDSGEVCSQSCNSNLITDNSTSQFEQWSFENGQCQWSPFRCSSPANRFESRDVCNAYCNFQRRARTLPAEAAVSLKGIFAYCAMHMQNNHR